MDIKLEIRKLINESAVQEHSNTLNRVVEQQNFEELAEEIVKFISFNFPVSGQLDVSDGCKCIRLTGGNKWHANGCKVHKNG